MPGLCGFDFDAGKGKEPAILLWYLENHDGILLSSLKAVHLGSPKIIRQTCTVLCRKHAMKNAKAAKMNFESKANPLRSPSIFTGEQLRCIFAVGPLRCALSAFQGAGCSGCIACLPPRPSTASCPTRILSADYVLGSRGDAGKFASNKTPCPCHIFYLGTKKILSHSYYRPVGTLVLGLDLLIYWFWGQWRGAFKYAVFMLRGWDSWTNHQVTTDQHALLRHGAHSKPELLGSGKQ